MKFMIDKYCCPLRTTRIKCSRKLFARSCIPTTTCCTYNRI